MIGRRLSQEEAKRRLTAEGWVRPPADRIELVAKVIYAWGIGRSLVAAWKKEVSSCLHTKVHERGLNFQIRFRYSRSQFECFQVAFCRFANFSFHRSPKLIFTL